MHVRIPGLLLATASMILMSTASVAHRATGDDAHTHAHPPILLAAGQAGDNAATDPAKTSGQGDLTFRVLRTASLLPEEAQNVLVNSHGGFAVDRRDGRGETYFALPGAGILRISSDLGAADLLLTARQVKDSNMHNTTIWYGSNGAPFLAFPANGDEKVLTTNLNGQIMHVLNSPERRDFTADAVNVYFRDGGKFVPTDVEFVNGTYYITTGYSALDYVLTARLEKLRPFTLTWEPHAFGGKGGEPGQFGTGHGITATPDGGTLTVADRPNAELDRFDLEGSYLDTVNLPAGSFPCDVDYAHGYALVACLHGPDREKGAPLYLLENNKVVSTIMPKEELGLDKFQHIHNAVLRKIDDKLYIIVQAWNPGDFAILEQVVD